MVSVTTRVAQTLAWADVKKKEILCDKFPELDYFTEYTSTPSSTTCLAWGALARAPVALSLMPTWATSRAFPTRWTTSTTVPTVPPAAASTPGPTPQR